MKMNDFRLATARLLMLAAVLLVVTGYGITEYRLIESLSLGLLDKSLSFRAHSALAIPFVLLLLIHAAFSSGFLRRLWKR